MFEKAKQSFIRIQKRLNEVNRDAPEATGIMYDFCVGKHEAELTALRSQMKVNASHLDTER
jgi:hypothetical protein